MDFFFRKATVTKKPQTPKEAFLNTEEKVDKLMQPNNKIHIYTEDDLINYLSKTFDLMGEIEKEMVDLVQL